MHLQAVDPAEFQELCAKMGTIDPLQEEEVLDLFQNPVHTTMAEAEMKALTRTFGGVMWANEERWVRAQPLPPARVALNSFPDRSVQAPQIVPAGGFLRAHRNIISANRRRER